ncbi:MAG: F0F1 ATP synthase subunit gamma [Planctomycetota bacterium]|nr:F0F1 ATP synthase subunit gamma [Planctomycetota bacterium]
MAQARDLLRRIRSVKNTQQITRAMKMVAASKLRKVLDDTLALRPYAEGITKVDADLVECNPDLARELYGEQREQKRVGVLFFTGDKGLCGSFNANLNKEMLNFINADEGMDFKISC